MPEWREVKTEPAIYVRKCVVMTTVQGVFEPVKYHENASPPSSKYFTLPPYNPKQENIWNSVDYDVEMPKSTEYLIYYFYTKCFTIPV